MNYYNEYDKHAAAWLRELIAQQLIPAGDVDERSICDVSAADLRGYTQCHFFAGIGGWSYALQLAGWPASRPVWSASCPCQPFSSAGKGLAQADERHLWPVFFNLLKECRPQYVFGEQVASAIGHGWLDGISADLDQEGYACGSAVLGAHSVGSPHIRQRLYWVAYDSSERLEGATRAQLQGRDTRLARRCEFGYWSDSQLIHCRDGKARRIPTQGGSEPVFQRMVDGLSCGLDIRRNVINAVKGFPVAEKVPNRAGLLKGYGNAIVPSLASEFIQAAEEAITSSRQQDET